MWLMRGVQNTKGPGEIQSMFNLNGKQVYESLGFPPCMAKCYMGCVSE